MEPPIEAIKALPPDQVARIELARAYTEQCSFVCSCQMSATFHIDWPAARDILEARASGVLVACGDHKIYRGSRSEDFVELVQVIRDLEWSHGVLEEIRSDYIPGQPLGEQGAVGAHLRKVLRTSMDELGRGGLLPDYWASVRFNATAILLMLRRSLKKRARVIDFLRYSESLGGDFDDVAFAALPHELTSVAKVMQDERTRMRSIGHELSELAARLRVVTQQMSGPNREKAQASSVSGLPR